MTNTAMHETRHALAAAVGLVALDVPREVYDSVQVHVWVAPRGQQGEDGAVGEFGLLPCKELPERVYGPATELMAYGPCAALPKAVRGLLTDDPHVRGAVFHQAGLSGADRSLAERWSGLPQTPGLVVRGVQILEAGLGLARMVKLSQLVRGIAVEDLPDMPRLKTLVPYAAAHRAWNKARLELSARSAA